MTQTKIARKSVTARAKESTSVATKSARPADKQAPAVQPGPVDGKAHDAETSKPKHKLVRDSFTIPKSEYSVLEGLKTRAANLKRPTKKSEVLRAGIVALHGLTDKAFLAALASVPSLKTGRPIAAKKSAAPAKKAPAPANKAA